MVTQPLSFVHRTVRPRNQGVGVESLQRPYDALQSTGSPGPPTAETSADRRHASLRSHGACAQRCNRGEDERIRNALKDSRLLADVWRGAGTVVLSVWWFNSDRCEVIDQRVEAIGNGSNACADVGFQGRLSEKGGLTVKFRRRAPRQPAGWMGSARSRGSSPPGAGSSTSQCSRRHHARSPLPVLVVGRHISSCSRGRHSASIRLEGKVTNARLTLRTTVRVGIEFDSPSADLVSKVGGHARRASVVYALPEDTELRQQRTSRCGSCRRTVQPALWATSQTYPSGSANAPLVPPHSATAACRTIEPPARWASSSTSATSSTERTLRANELDPRNTMATENSPQAKDHPPDLKETPRRGVIFHLTTRGPRRNVDVAHVVSRKSSLYGAIGIALALLL